MVNTFIAIREEESRVLFLALLLESNRHYVTIKIKWLLPIHTTPINKLPTVFLLKFREHDSVSEGNYSFFLSPSPSSPRNSQKKFNRSVPLHRRNLKLQSGGARASGEKTMPKRKKEKRIARLGRSGDRLRHFLPAICHCTLSALGIDKCHDEPHLSLFLWAPLRFERPRTSRHRGN